MLGLLNPLALWLAPLILTPLIIHFLGRNHPKSRDFPSLILVRGQMAKAMRRHRVKNWLQLVLRTAALCCLILAAGDPLWRPATVLAPPQAAGLLLHNGAYAALPLPGSTMQAESQSLRRSLDSLTGGRCDAELLLPDAASGSARFGNYREALARLARRASSHGSYHLYAPVFDWKDLESAGDFLTGLLRENPELRLILTEYPSTRLSPFNEFRLELLKTGTASLRAGVAAKAGAVLWTPRNGAPREVSVSGGQVEVLLPAQPGFWAGSFSLPTSEPFAFTTAWVSARLPPPSQLCHVSASGGIASLASMGREGWRRRIQSHANSQSLGPCDFLYLADPPGSDVALLTRAAETVRRGGKVVLGLGQHADPGLLNRTLLVPLGVGRLTDRVKQDATRIRPHVEAFGKLGMDIRSWGEPGEVKTHVSMVVEPGTTSLLTLGKNPILVHRRVGSGAILVWTTNLDDSDWTDLGLGPWPALIHQAFASDAGELGATLRHVDADSTWVLPALEGGDFQVFDPLGSKFGRIRREPTGWRVGPFDRLGLYRAINGADTLIQAVVLDRGRQVENSGREARERFFSALGETRSHVAWLQFGEGRAGLYGGRSLRLWILAAAALLLLAEGAVSLALRPAPAAVPRG